VKGGNRRDATFIDATNCCVHRVVPALTFAMSSGSDIEMAEGPKSLAYDPEQNPEERRKIRKSYRALGKRLEGEFHSNAT
jgi:hypothetical protein